VKLHALVSDLETAKTAVEGGATVLQLRLKGKSTQEVVDEGRPFRHLCVLHGVTFVVNDDFEAAVELGADGVHLGRGDQGAEDAVDAGLMLGTSAHDVEEALAGERIGAAYVGAGPVWATPTKPDADPPIGLDGLAAICEAVSIPVVAIGGIDGTNAGDCFAAGADGVAVVRAAADARSVRAAIDEALAAR
jgi:thiamine-phosphate pyrophosphorylase